MKGYSPAAIRHADLVWRQRINRARRQGNQQRLSDLKFQRACWMMTVPLSVSNRQLAASMHKLARAFQAFGDLMREREDEEGTG